MAGAAETDMEYTFDAVFAVPLRLPEGVSGVLDFTGCVVTDAQDAAAVARHLKHYATNTIEYVADQIRAVDFGTELRACNLSRCDDRAFATISDALPAFTNLHKLHVHRCGLSSARLGQLFSALGRLPCFRDATGQLCTLAVGGNTVDDVGCALLLQNSGPLRGVEHFVLTRCNITDESLPTIAALVPFARRVYLSHTHITGVGVGDFLGALESCHLLGLDCTDVAAEGVAELVAAMRSRQELDTATRLEVWLRGIIMDTHWTSLLAFASSAKNSKQFMVKHDLQAEISTRPQHVVQVVDRVDVRLYIFGCHPVTVTHERVVCSKPILQLAREAVSELNLIAVGDERMPQDRIVRKRRQAYRDAFADVFASGILMNKSFTVGSVQFSKADIYTGEVHMTFDVAHKLLGSYTPRCNYVVDVEAEAL